MTRTLIEDKFTPILIRGAADAIVLAKTKRGLRPIPTLCDDIF